MFAFTRHPRRLAAALVTVVGWVTASVVVTASAALAKVAPDDPGFVTPTRSVTVTEVDASQLALTAAAACAIGIAATLLIEMVVRHGRHESAAHA